MLTAALALAAPACAQSRIAATGSVELAFAPWDQPEALVLHAIGEARDSILVQAYIFTSKRVAQALVAAAARGVRVEVLADATMHRRPKGNVLPMLIRGGIPVALDAEHASAHDKVIVIDADGENPAVITGSYNLTWSANHRNGENLLVLRGNRDLARAYVRNWHRHRREAQLVDAALRPLSR